MTSMMNAMPEFRRTKTAGVFVRHQNRCPAAGAPDARCRCTPSYRGRRRDPLTGKPAWSRTFETRAQVLSWLGATASTRAVAADRPSRTLGSLGDEWFDGVTTGAIAKRRGRAGTSYSAATLAGYRRSWENVLRPEFGGRCASEILEHEWQSWTDRLARENLSRSRIANHLAVASAIYSWASRPTRRESTGVHRNPLLAVELPANDEQPRLRVAAALEAQDLLAALTPDDAVPYAIAFYAGMRRAETHRLDWADVELDDFRITVRKAKSAAGTMRRLPIAQPLKPILLRAHLAQGKPTTGRVSPVSVMSGKLAERAMRAWGWTRDDTSKPWTPAVVEPLKPITLHECRHTYASFLMAAGYTLKEIMEYMGHADLQMVARYVKLLPQPAETNAADRLNAYLTASAKGGA